MLLQQRAGAFLLPAGVRAFDKQAGRQWQGGCGCGRDLVKRRKGSGGLALVQLQARQLQPRAPCTGCQVNGVRQQAACRVKVALSGLGLRLLAQVVRVPRAEIALLRLLHALGNRSGLRPVVRTFVDGQQRQPRLGFQRCAFQAAQCVFGTVEQAGLEVVQCQPVLCALAIGAAQVVAREQVLVHPDRPVVLTAAAKQIAQGKVQLRRIRIALHGFDEGVYRLVLLLVEQVVQTFEVGLGRTPTIVAPLALVQARSQPTENKRQRQAEQQPACVKSHGPPQAVVRQGRLPLRVPVPVGGVRHCGGATSAAPCRVRRRQRRA